MVDLEASRRTSLHRRWRVRTALLSSILVGSCQCGCPDCPDDPEDGNTPVPPVAASLEVIPDSVHVRAGEEFTLVALPRTSTGSPVSEEWGLDPDWEVTPAGGFTKTLDEGHRVTLAIHPATSTSVLTVVASLPGGIEGQAKIVVFPANTSGQVAYGGANLAATTPSWIRSQHADRQIPEVVLVRGANATTGGCLVFEPLAFAGAGFLGDITSQTACSLDRSLLFSPSTESLLRKPPWGPNAEMLNFDSPPVFGGPIDEAIEGPIEVQVSIWIATPGTGLKDRALDQLALANEIFEENRVGMLFVPRTIDGEQGPFVIRDLEVSTSEFERCKKVNLDEYFQDTAAGIGADARYKKDLNIFYASLPTNVRAEVCPPGPPTAAYGRVIYVNAGYEAYTSLAHELGHALSLRWPLGGHTHELGEVIGGFDSSNLMWSTSDDDAAEGRVHVSLGQAFRMNVDVRSWVNQGTRDPTQTGSPRIRDVAEPTEDCMCQDPYADTSEPCPRLSADIRSVSTAQPAVSLGTCPP